MRISYKRKKIICVVGARPNFMKIAPLLAELKKCPKVEPILLHTGQHYDETMSDTFFRDLNIPRPDINLNIGSKSHAVQTAEIMIKFEKVILKEEPDLVVVVGDVNSTLACALTAAKLNIPVAHVEAGLRSFDRTMPEETNRVLTDALSDYLFITEKSAGINLLKEGSPKEKIYFVGNIMVDTLLKNKEKAKNSRILDTLGLINHKRTKKIPYAYLTLHRPSNVDDKKVFCEIIEALNEIQKYIKVIWPVHPRTKNKIEEFNFTEKFNFLNNEHDTQNGKGIMLIEPLGYIDSLKLMSEARLVLTDSGGIQEETTILNVPCLTLRHNTERPVTVTQGTNVIVGTDKKMIIRQAANRFKNPPLRKAIPKFWDGKTAQRITEIILNHKI